MNDRQSQIRMFFVAWWVWGTSVRPYVRVCTTFGKQSTVFTYICCSGHQRGIKKASFVHLHKGRSGTFSLCYHIVSLQRREHQKVTRRLTILHRQAHAHKKGCYPHLDIGMLRERGPFIQEKGRWKKSSVNSLRVLKGRYICLLFSCGPLSHSLFLHHNSVLCTLRTLKREKERMEKRRRFARCRDYKKLSSQGL